jgi:acyl carrier protein
MNNEIAEIDYITERNALVERVKASLISSLNLDYAPEQIHADEILFGAGFGLDSIDSLQLTVAIKSDLGVEIKDTDMWALRSVNTLVDYIMKDKGLLDWSQARNRLDSYTVNDSSLLGYNQIRNDAIFFENTDYLLLRLNGEEELLKLNALVSKDIDFTPEGSVTQTLLLDNEGSLISNLYFMNNFDHHYLLFPKENQKNILTQLQLANIEFDDITSRCTFFSLEGYKASEIIETCFDVVASLMRPYTFSLETLGGEQEFLTVRIDTYGEFGYLIVSFDNLGKEAILQRFASHDIPVSNINEQITFNIMQLLWLESCHFHPSICFLKGENLIEAGLAALLSFDKDNFIGKKALESMVINNRLVHFQSDKSVEIGDLLTVEGSDVGYVVACHFSPLLNLYVGNAYVSKKYSVSGASFESKKNSATISLVSAPQIMGHSYLDII